MKYAITIDEVLRDMITQMQYVYTKYVAKTNIDYHDVKNDDFSEIFKFESKELYKQFLYSEASMELFGMADQMRLNMMEPINEFLYDFYADKEHSITVVSKNHGRGVPATLFWLSKVASDFRNFEMVPTYEDIWDKYDVIITATPEIIQSKPEDKIVIKIKAPYNLDLSSDFVFDTVEEVFTTPNFLTEGLKIITQKTN